MMAMRGRFGGVVVLLGLVVRLVAVLQPLADLLVLLPALLDPLSPTLLAVLGLALGGPLSLALNRDGVSQGRQHGTTRLVLPSPRAQSSTPPATQWSIPSGALACRSEERNCLEKLFKDDLRSLGSDQLQHEGKISQEKKIWTEIGHLSGNFRRKTWIFAVNFLLIIKIIDKTLYDLRTPKCIGATRGGYGTSLKVVTFSYVVVQ